MEGCGGVGAGLEGFGFGFCTMHALIDGNQFAAFDIKLLFFDNSPFMKTAAAQAIAFVPWRRRRAFKRNNLSHDYFLAMLAHAASQVGDK